METFTRATKSSQKYTATKDGLRFDLTKFPKNTTANGYTADRPWHLRIGRLEGSWPVFVGNEWFDSKDAAESFVDSYAA